MMEQKSVLKKELFRKSIHLCSAFVPFFLKHFYIFTLSALAVVVVLYSISEALRLKGINVPIVAQVTQLAARKRDENKFVFGPVALVMGIVAAAIIFPIEYARIGIFALAFGDGLASLFGKTFGKKKIPHTGGKTFVGSFTCFVAVFVSSFICSGNVTVSAILGVLTMVLEMQPIGDADNITIPVMISFFAQLLL